MLEQCDRKNRAKIRIFDYNPSLFPEPGSSQLPACVFRIPRLDHSPALLEQLVSVPEFALHILVEFSIASIHAFIYSSGCARSNQGRKCMLGDEFGFAW